MVKSDGTDWRLRGAIDYLTHLGDGSVSTEPPTGVSDADLADESPAPGPWYARSCELPHAALSVTDVAQPSRAGRS